MFSKLTRCATAVLCFFFLSQPYYTLITRSHIIPVLGSDKFSKCTFVFRISSMSIYNLEKKN
jgi:hypothetical protein